MKVSVENDTMTIFLEGRIDTSNASQTEKELLSAVESKPSDVTQPILDASEL